MSEAGAEPVLSLDVRHRVHAGLNIEAALEIGRQRAVIFGTSGAGKTTLLKLIAGLETPDSGRITLGGRLLHDAATGVRMSLRHRKIGMIFQRDWLFPHLSVAGNIRFGLQGWSRREARARVSEIASLCGIVGLLDRRPTTLSGGERQRVGLARALAPRPALLLCDEPVSALDLPNRQALVDRIAWVQEAEGVPLLYVTHSPAEAMAIGSVLFRMDAGRIVDRGPVLDVLARAPLAAALGLSGPEGLMNTFRAEVIDASDPAMGHTSVVRLTDGGPTLVVPAAGQTGDRLTVRVRADEIVLAVGPVPPLSARNVLEAQVERILMHGSEAEVVARTGDVAWVVGIVSETVGTLGLVTGTSVRLIIKARSCQVTTKEPEA